MPIDQPKPGTPALTIPQLKEWKARTSAGTITSRHSLLMEVDKSIGRYHQMVEQGAQDRETAALFMHFFKYKSTHASWKTDPRNMAHGELQKLDDFLNNWMDKGSKLLSQATIPPEDMRVWRQGVCFALAKSEIVGYFDLSWSNIKNTSVSGYNGIAAVNKVVDVAAGKHVALDGGVISSLTDSVKEFVSHLAASSGGGGDNSKLADSIMSGLPDILKNIGGAIASVAGPMTALKIVGDIRTAIKSKLLLNKTADLAAGVHAGSPRDIVESIRSQTFDKMMASIKAVIKNALLSVAAIVPFGAVIKAISAVYEFISALWYHYREREVIRSIFLDAKGQSSAKLYNETAEFNQWFKSVIAKSPFVASYIISLPMTGGYYGFLNLYYDDGTNISNATLQLNYNNLDELKKGAGGYVRDSKIRIKAVEGDKLLQMSLDCVYRQDGLNPTTFQRAMFCLSCWILIPIKKKFS